MKQSIALFLTLAATALAAPGPAPQRSGGLHKRLESRDRARGEDAPSRRSENAVVSTRSEADEDDEAADEWEGTDDGWDTTAGVCKPATYDCKPCHTGWIVCDWSGTWVSAGDCPDDNLCYLDPRNRSPYCVATSLYDQMMAKGGAV